MHCVWVQTGVRMARSVEKLSALGVAKASKPGYYGDGAGLWLQVSKSATKSWIFRYTFGGKQREMGLGATHTVSLAEARSKAKACRSILLSGQDPLDVRKASQLATELERARMVTFDHCATAYILAHRGGWRNAKHARQWENTLATYASPVIGALPVAAIDTSMVMKVLSPIWHTKTETATRLRGRIESILDWATVNTYRQGENPARWRGHLENLLAKPSKISKVVHFPALPWQEVGGFVAELRLQVGVAARAVEFTILTGTRSGDVRGATWSEINFDEAVWTIPAGRIKAEREHRVPLSQSALALLRSVQRTDGVVFLGRRPGSKLSDMSLTAVLRRMGHKVITVHGFRSTFRDWAAESVTNTFPREVCEHALAHSLPDKVEAAYQRGDLFEKRKLLMQAWANYCDEIPNRP